jgi:hypothetical protein
MLETFAEQILTPSALDMRTLEHHINLKNCDENKSLKHRRYCMCNVAALP